MNESSRPHESSSIDEGLRTRLEGTIELLEDALPLLDSLMRVLVRVEPTQDDAVTLQECVLQLPRIDEAIDRANRHEQAGALTRLVARRKDAAHTAANDRLRSLNSPEVPSLRGAAAALLELVRRQASLPRPEERRLMESAGPAWADALVLGSISGALFYGMGVGTVITGVLGVFSCFAWLYARTPARWSLHPGRLYLHPWWPKLGRDIVPASIKGMKIEGQRVTIQLQSESVTVWTRAPTALASLLGLLGTPWLSGLQSVPSGSEVVEGLDLKLDQRGLALITGEGVLFVRLEGMAAVLKALTAEALPRSPTLEELLGLLAHLPGPRLAALAEHLAQTAGAYWFPLNGLSLYGSTLKLGDQRVRLTLTTKQRSELLQRKAA